MYSPFLLRRSACDTLFRRKDHRAFTLVELLVALVIVAMLVSMIFAGVGGLGEMKIRTRCVNNLRKIGVGVNLYTSEHQGKLFLPYSGHTPYIGNMKGLGGDTSMQGFAALAPYLTPNGQKMELFDVFHCPGNPVPRSELRVSWETKTNLHGSYNQYCGFGPKGLNSGFYPNSRDTVYDMERSQLVFVDITMAGGDAGLSNHRNSNGSASGANVLYLSGDVEWVPLKYLTYSVTRSGGTFLFPDAYKR